MPNVPLQPGALPPGSVFQDRYEVVCCLKSGGMGAIYECIDRNTERHRALKAMLPEIVADAGLRARFKLEATITADVDSEHIVDVFDAGVDEQTGVPFLVMELLKGEDLGALLRRSKRLAPAEVVLLLHQASRALDQTHAVFIVHRDLKPENLFLTHRSDGSPHLKLLDFGIAKIIAQSGAAKTTAVVGTPLYMSPEQASGAGTIGPAADIYALGHITFTLLAGEAFWEQDARRSPSLVAFMLKVVEGSAESARERACALGAELPSGFDAWFAKATAPSPQNRFVTASELVLALADVLGVPLPRETSRPQLAGLASGSEAEQPRPALPGIQSTGSPTWVSEPAPVEPTNTVQRRRTQAYAVVAVLIAAVALGLGAAFIGRGGESVRRASSATPGVPEGRPFVARSEPGKTSLPAVDAPSSAGQLDRRAPVASVQPLPRAQVSAEAPAVRSGASFRRDPASRARGERVPAIGPEPLASENNDPSNVF